MPNTTLMVASSDEHFREMVRDNLINLPDAKIVAEYQEVAANLYIRVLQDLERHPHAGLIVDISGDPEGAIKAIEKVKQAAPDLFVMVSNFSTDGEMVIQLLVNYLQKPASYNFKEMISEEMIMNRSDTMVQRCSRPKPLSR